MKEIINEIICLGNKMKGDENKDIFAKEGIPATTVMIKKLKKTFGNKISPSYTKLLSIYDGITNFEWTDLSLISIAYLLENQNLDEDWEIEDWGAINYSAGELFIFGQSDSDSHLLAFDLTKPNSNGEYNVVHFDTNGVIGEPYENLETYLNQRFNWFQKSAKQ